MKFQKKVNSPKINATNTRINLYAKVINIILNVQYRNIFKFSVVIPNASHIGCVTKAAVEPVIPKTTNIFRIWKFEFIPHLTFNFSNIL